MIKNTLYPISYFIKNYPVTGMVVIAALLISGISEGIGIVALMPLLQFVMEGSASSDSTINRFFYDLFGFFGFEVTLLSTLAFVISFISLKAIVKLAAMYIVSKSAADMVEKFRLDLADSIISAHWNFFASKPSGHVSAAINNEPNLAANCLVKSCNFIAEAIQIVIYLIIAFCVSWWVTLGAIGLAIVGTFTLGSVFRKSRRAGEDQTNYQKTLLANITDSMKIMKPIRAMGAESHFKPFVHNSIRKLKKANMWILLSPHIVEQSNEIIKVVSLGIGLYVLVGIWDEGIDGLFILAILFVRILQRLNLLQKTFIVILSQIPAFLHIQDAIAEARINAEEWRGTTEPEFKKAITFENVHYGHKGKVILDNASFDLKKNHMTLITGPSGQGKSTIADLVSGLYKAADGRILIDGHDIKDVDITKWRHKIGYVPQDSILLNDTIRNNITLYNESINDKDIDAALKQAGAYDFVQDRENGIETIVGESGSKLSGGQKQRILLARALVRHPSLLILDEASAGLDEQTERSIFDELKGLSKDLTIIAITHNEKLKQYADDVYVLDRHTLNLETTG